MSLGENIRNLREGSNITQQQLANKLYVSRQTICRWENGSRCPDLITAKKLAMEFNVSLDTLISSDDVKNTTETFCWRKPEKFKNIRELEEDKKTISTFIEIVSSIYLLSMVFIRVQMEMKIPIWFLIIGICIEGPALIKYFITLKKINALLLK